MADIEAASTGAEAEPARQDTALPTRIDYVLLTSNPNENNATRHVFKITTRPVVEQGLCYSWTKLRHKTSNRYVHVAHVSLRDQPGGTSAAIATEQIIDILSPTYIFVLGTAGGISQTSDEINPGDAIIPDVVHTCTFGDNQVRPAPSADPCPALVAYAMAIGGDRDWRRKIGKTPPERMTRPPRVHVGDLGSTGNNIFGIGDPVLRGLLMGYPRIRAVEMEISGVARALHAAQSDSSRHVPAYLAIKGISDVPYVSKEYKETQDFSRDFIDKNLSDKLVASGAKERVKATLAIALAVPPDNYRDLTKAQREKWSPYASHVSAGLARQIVETYPIASGPTPFHRIWPDRTGAKRFGGTIGVLTEVDPIEYSEIASDLLLRYSDDFDRNIHFFTVCAFTPRELFELTKKAYRRKKGHESRSTDDLILWAKSKFIHFRDFSNHAAKYPNKCARLLVCESRDLSLPRAAEDRQAVKFFKELNGDVPLWIIDRDEVEDDQFLTDYAIIGEDVLLDYYPDSRVLHIGELSPRHDSKYFRRLFDDFLMSRHERRSRFRGSWGADKWPSQGGERAG